MMNTRHDAHPRVDARSHGSAPAGEPDGQTATPPASNRNGHPPEICAYYRGRPQRVLLTDVIYLRADQKYVSVHHPDGMLLVDQSLRTFEQAFPELLVRIHRNALVARSRLRGLERQPDGSTRARLLDCDDTLVVSRRYLREVRRWLRETLEPDHGQYVPVGRE